MGEDNGSKVRKGKYNISTKKAVEKLSVDIDAYLNLMIKWSVGVKSFT